MGQLSGHAAAAAARQPTNREQWLTEMAVRIANDFDRVGHRLDLGRIRLTCGFPSKGALARRRRVIGQCWSPSASADGTTEVLISPTIADSLVVAATLVHELVHAAVGNAAGHGPLFREVAVQLGLAGKMTATVAGPELTQRLNALIADLGPYPHAVLDWERGPAKKQSTRLLKIRCPNCGYVARVTQVWVAVGLPTCPCGSLFLMG